MRIRFLLRSVALGFVLLSAAVAPAACTGEAADVSTDQAKAEVARVVADFNAAWTAQDYDRMLSLSLPQPMLDEIMRQYGVDAGQDREQVATEIREMMEQALSQAKVITATMDSAAAEIMTSPAGRKYALVPSVVEVDVQGTHVRSTGRYLAFDDGGRWYLIDPSGADAVEAIKAVFPDLADVPLTPSQMEVISQ